METIPPKLLKSNVDIFLHSTNRASNKLDEDGIFPNGLKLADVSSVFKKDDSVCKKNYLANKSSSYHLKNILATHVQSII